MADLVDLWLLLFPIIPKIRFKIIKKKKLDLIFFWIGTQFFKLKKLFFFLLNLIKLMFIYFKIYDLDFCFNFLLKNMT